MGDVIGVFPNNSNLNTSWVPNPGGLIIGQPMMSPWLGVQYASDHIHL